MTRLIEPMARRGVNLTSLQLRPIAGKPWEYYFFIDFTGHVEDRVVSRVLAELKRHCSLLKILGSYPMAEPLDR